MFQQVPVMQNLQLWEWEHLAVCQMALVPPRVCGLKRHDTVKSQKMIM